MLSQKLLDVLRKESIHYIVGARLANAPPTLIERVSRTLDQRDGAIVRVPSKHGDMVCQFSPKRYKKDHAIMQQQLAKAQTLVARGEPGRRAKFVSHNKSDKGYAIDQALLQKTTRLLGIKGYSGSPPRSVMERKSVPFGSRFTSPGS